MNESEFFIRFLQLIPFALILYVLCIALFHGVETQIDR